MLWRGPTLLILLLDTVFMLLFLTVKDDEELITSLLPLKISLRFQMDYVI